MRGRSSRHWPVARSANGQRNGLAAPSRLYKTGKQEGGFDVGIERALQLILASPKFVFRLERDPANLKPGAVYKVSDFDLASRLSFFLWSSIPDEELLAEASAGRLKNPAVLERQTRRMLADPRRRRWSATSPVNGCTSGTCATCSPMPTIFQISTTTCAEAFRRETELLFESVMRDDRSVVDLLQADYTFVNERLARHYGIPNVYGSQFRRVQCPTRNASATAWTRQHLDSTLRLGPPLSFAANGSGKYSRYAAAFAAA